MNEERLYRVIVGPHISEKGTRASEENRQVVFKVATSATKIEIKKAVEHLFKVEVAKVTVANVQGKQRRHGKFVGQRSDWKKAYVSLKEGHDINFMSA